MHRNAQQRWSNALSLAVVAATFDPQQTMKQQPPVDDAQQPPMTAAPAQPEEETPSAEH